MHGTCIKIKIKSTSTKVKNNLIKITS